jgi:hypothetical protein
MFIPDPDFCPSPIPDPEKTYPGSKWHQIPDPNQQHCHFYPQTVKTRPYIGSLLLLLDE